MSTRLLYVLPHSTDAPERAATGLAAAAAGAAAGHETALWLHGEGVRLAVQGVAETMAHSATPAAAGSLEILRAHGAALYASRPCFEAREFADEQVVEGGSLAAPAELAALVAEGFLPISL